MGKAKTIYIHPLENQHNPYTSTQVNTLKNLGFELKAINALRKNIFALIFSSADTRLCILNWFESRLVNQHGRLSLKGVFSFFGYLLILTLTNTKVFWIRHNHKPHASVKSNFLITVAIKLLEKKSSAIIVHSKELSHQKEIYIAHPLYCSELPKVNPFNQNNPIYLAIGNIQKYKGLDDLLQQWPENTLLKIYGQLKDPLYGAELKAIIQEKNLNVELHFGYLSDQELDNVLKSSDAIVLSHKEKSAIVSGNYFLAKSYGLMTIVRKDSVYYEASDPFIHTFNNKVSLCESIEATTNKMKSFSKEQVFNNANPFFGENVILEQWRNLFRQHGIL
jgi:glycosyltransferase involved in cell wall biosynthesis